MSLALTPCLSCLLLRVTLNSGATESFPALGGAMVLGGTISHPVAISLTACTLNGNYVLASLVQDGFGGGIVTFGVSVSLAGCTFVNNNCQVPTHLELWL